MTDETAAPTPHPEDQPYAEGRALAVPRADEWYPNECQFCDRDAALACQDAACRAVHLGEDGDFPGNGRDSVAAQPAESAAPVEAETPAPPTIDMGYLSLPADMQQEVEAEPSRDEVVEEWAATWDGVDRSGLPKDYSLADLTMDADDHARHAAERDCIACRQMYAWYGDEALSLIPADHVHAPAVKGVDYQGPQCANSDCRRQLPGRPCETWEGYDGKEWCPRCGWAEKWHPVAAQPEPQGEPDEDWRGRFADDGKHYCPEGHNTVYQMFSGGREWFCPDCDNQGTYPPAPADVGPRARLLTQPGGVAELKRQMDEHLASPGTGTEAGE